MHSSVLPHRTRQQELDEAELEAEAEGAATAGAAQAATRGHGEAVAHHRADPPPSSSLSDETDYILATLAQLNHSHAASFAPGAVARARAQAAADAPASHAHPSIQVHAVHGLDPRTDSRATIEAKLEAIDQARKLEKKNKEREAQGLPPLQPPPSALLPAAKDNDEATRVASIPAPLEAADESVLRMLALRKLQLLQQHLRCDNQPVLVLAATATHGNLYLGSVGVSHHLPHLLGAGMTHVLSVGRNLAQPFPQHFQYFYVPMLDSSTTRITKDVYEACWEFIERGRTGAPRKGHGLALIPPTAGENQTAAAAADAAVAANNAAAASEEKDGSATSPSKAPSAVSRSSAGQAAAGSGRAALAASETDEGRVQSRPAHPASSSSATPSSSTSSTSTASAAAAAAPLQKGNVLVHCFAGKSRSTTILLSYLMHAHHWSLDQAYAHVKKCRPAISPNPGFLAQLRELEAKLQEERAAAATTPAGAGAAATAAAPAGSPTPAASPQKKA